MYTPKLIEIFIKDRVNMAVLTFFVFSSAQGSGPRRHVGPGRAEEIGGVYPRTSLWLAFESVTLGWSILIPISTTSSAS